MHKKLTNLEAFALTNDIAAQNNYEMCQQIHDGKLLIEFNKNISHHRHSQICARYRCDQSYFSQKSIKFSFWLGKFEFMNHLYETN